MKSYTEFQNLPVSSGVVVLSNELEETRLPRHCRVQEIRVSSRLGQASTGIPMMAGKVSGVRGLGVMEGFLDFS
ncbi:hypothetical protein NG798_02060 [Ancylothrix sp. C2]|uniref:hypothetical protein n=1 Tax=Ancylothrix sp. D3o TaxID=2953691 RepID=UPI0021BB8153|nr:hypothetical protein [Ancylothrix sp. D3o]MCT7948566.1 hypothetical protein [Ancylothrix sp. D3o]